MQSLFARIPPMCGVVAMAFALTAPSAGAAQDDANANSVAAGGTGVARISLIEGDVAVQRGDSGDPLAAAPNTPVLAGDYVTTGDSSRAEIQLDGYSHVRLDQDAQIRFTHLDPNSRSLQLAAGTIELRLMHGPDGTSVIDTPSITIKPQAGGKYRVTVTPDGQTLVTVRSGDAQIQTPQGPQDLRRGMTVSAQGDAASPSIRTQPGAALDDFDRFNVDRDRIDAPAIAISGFVNPDIGGTSDLAANGRWVSDGSYGNVWVPAVGTGWAPYRDGRWAWEEGYGWTWIATEPWGWAPYHYGSWYNSPNYGWCWYPPQPRVFVPWRPALVAFIGFGGGSGFSLSFGGGNAIGQIGWVPLAPFEPYHPWWNNRYGGGAIANNVTNITNISVYKNVQYNAVSGVSSQQFLQGNFTHTVAMTPTQLRGGLIFRGALPVVPTASNLRFTNSTAVPRVALRPAIAQHAFAGKPVVLRRTPFTTQRVTLATATRAVLTPLHFRDALTTPLVPPALGQAPPPTNFPHTTPMQGAPTVHPATASGGGGAWNRFNAPRPSNGTPAHIAAPVKPTIRYVAPQTSNAPAPRPPTAPHSPEAQDTFGVSRAQDTVRAPRAPDTARTPHAPAVQDGQHPPHVPHAAPRPGHAPEKKP